MNEISQMEQSPLSNGIKKKIGIAVVLIIMAITPFIFLFMMMSGTMTAAEESFIEEYKKAATLAGCSWQSLLAFDTVRYENDFEEADPNASALEFLIVEYEIYKKSQKGEWIKTSSGTLNHPQDIKTFFGLPEDAGIAEVAESIKTMVPPQYVIYTSAKNLNDVISEHSFDEDQIEWLALLLTDGGLGEIFGDTSNLPDFIAPEGSGYFGWPIPGCTRITSPFAPRWGEHHDGMDIAAPVGTPVVAVEKGVVVGASVNGGTAGIYVVIKHEKDGVVWQSKYFHLSSYKVKIGDQVERGTVIAASGNTGNSTGPHLHVGITLNGVYTDPAPLLLGE